VPHRAGIGVGIGIGIGVGIGIGIGGGMGAAGSRLAACSAMKLSPLILATGGGLLRLLLQRLRRAARSTA
jgi:hypothetical protein